MSDNPVPETPARSRADISRANGAKSKGPITPRGKAISSRNSTRHGITSRLVVLPGESADSYVELYRSYIDHFRPQGIVELDLVSVMASTRWRLRRLVSVETNYLAHELHSRRDEIRRFVDNPDRDKSLAWTFSRVSGGTVLPLMTRYEAALHRTFDRALKQLQTLRADAHKNIKKPTQDSNPES